MEPIVLQQIEGMASDSSSECSVPSSPPEVPKLPEGLRRRWLEQPLEEDDPLEVPGLREVKELLARDDEASVLEEEDEGCPLPSTPIDTELIDNEVGILFENISLKVYLTFAIFINILCFPDTAF